MLPRTHPRRVSLRERGALELGVKKGLTHIQGLLAHGRGEAFDYLMGEKTTGEARKAIRAAAARLLLAKHPVISVNGNVAALCARDVVRLARAVGAQIEVNLFYRSEARMRKIVSLFKREHNVQVLHTLRGGKCVPGLSSKRALVNTAGIWKADVVLVPLEDGDRTEALRRMHKFVIAIDLNPLSRTAQKASLSIVDNVTRAMPFLAKEARRMRKMPQATLRSIARSFDNKKSLKNSLRIIKHGVQ